jgi:hypothetical protein
MLIVTDLLQRAKVSLVVDSLLWQHKARLNCGDCLKVNFVNTFKIIGQWLLLMVSGLPLSLSLSLPLILIVLNFSSLPK